MDNFILRLNNVLGGREGGQNPGVQPQECDLLAISGARGLRVGLLFNSASLHRGVKGKEWVGCVGG